MGFYFVRAALGASWDPTTFDGTKVVSMCYGDYDVSPPLVSVVCQPNTIPIFSERLVGDPGSPRVHRRTGYGIKITLPLTPAYETGVSTLGNPGSHAGTDGTLAAISSVLARSSGGVVGTPGSANPPYLFFSPNYQSAFEQWLPVEIDASAGDPEIPQDYPFGKNLVREMQLPLACSIAFADVSIVWQPYCQMFNGSPALANVPAHGGGPPYTGSLSLSAPLAAQYVVGDAILVWNPPLQWFDFTITSISGGRTTIGFTTQNVWPGTLPSNRFRIRKANDGFFVMPVFTIHDYSGTQLYVPGFKPLPSFVTLLQ